MLKVGRKSTFLDFLFASVISICKKNLKKIIVKKFLFLLLPPLSNLHFCVTIENTLEKLQIWSIFEKTMKEVIKTVTSVISDSKKK